jgi:peptide subunit release factor 1 (eRF1)
VFDDLLGRTELRERIEELEVERERLASRLEAEQRRAREAKHARQEAEERANRLEDRIADLEGQLERADETGGEPSFRRTEALSGDRVDAVLDRLGSFDADAEGALSASVPDGKDVPDPVRETLGDRTRLVARAAPCLVYADDAGLVGAALRAPVPPEPFVAWEGAFRLDPAWFRPTGRYGLALVRSDTFALGTYEAGERVAVEGFTTNVGRDHSKGGFSQARFERLRDGRIEDHLDRCRAALDDAPDRLFVVGERDLLGEFADRAERTRTVDATGDPERALADAHHDFWTVRLFGL